MGSDVFRPGHDEQPFAELQAVRRLSRPDYGSHPTSTSHPIPDIRGEGERKTAFGIEIADAGCPKLGREGAVARSRILQNETGGLIVRSNYAYLRRMITREVDERDSIIFVRGSGAWTRAEVDEHFRALRRLIQDMRIADRPVRLLSDVTLAERQSPELEAHIKRQHDQTYKPGDRVALLVRDLDDKQHARAALGLADVAVFNSQLAAEMWLVEDSLKRPA